MKNNHDSPWQTKASRIVYQNPWVTIREDKVITPGGTDGIYGVIEAKSGVFVIALTPDNKIYIQESYRYPTRSWRWELPTGGIDAGATPAEAAKKELEEELGLVADTWTELGTYNPSYGGMLTDSQTVFLAQGLHKTAARLEAGELIRAVKTVTLQELHTLIANGTFCDGQSLAALMYFERWYEKYGPRE